MKNYDFRLLWLIDFWHQLVEWIVLAAVPFKTRRPVGRPVVAVFNRVSQKVLVEIKTSAYLALIVHELLK